MKFSASMIKSWMQCQQQAKFGYIDKLPQKQNAAAEFGTAVHLALEQYNKGMTIEEAKDVFADYWVHVTQDPELIWPARTSFGSYREKGLKMLDEHHESRKWATDTLIAQEMRFCVPIGRHELSGIIDAIYVDEATRTLNVCDYKSGYRPNSENLHLNIQFTSYIWAVSQREFWVGIDGSDKYVGFSNGEELFEKYEDYRKSGFWLDLRNAKSYSVGPRGTVDIVRLYRCLDAIEEAITAGVFVPNISGDSCRICSFQDECTAYLSSEQSGKDLEL